MKHAQNILFSFITLALIACSSLRAQAQTADSANPDLLSSREVSGQEEPRGQSHYYSFIAGPGDVTVKVNGATDFYSTIMRVIVRDPKSRELVNVAFSANSDDSTKSASFHLLNKESLTMQLMFAVDVGVHIKYTVNLGGAVFLKDDSMLAQRPDATSEDKPESSVKLASAAVAASNGKIQNHGDQKTVYISNDEQHPSSASAINKPIDDKWAVIIGISKFQKPEIGLKYPAKDAQDLRDFLVKEANFAPDHVRLLLDQQATKTNVLAEIGDKWLPHLVHPNDLVLIFISSHGSPSNVDQEGLNYLVMHDTDPGSLYATGLPLQDLAAAIKQRVHANRVVLIVDACHSGAANPAKGLIRIGNFDSDSLLLGTGQLVICSSEPSQVSWESKRYPNGVFTHQLIQALRANGGKVSLGEAFEQMKESVVSEVLKDRGEVQSPVLKSRWSGNDLILSAPCAHPHAVPQDMQSR